jgi:pilus assembly protein CpaB
MRKASETVLTNVRILGVDQRTNDQKAEAKVPKTATLEVTPKQAEKLMLSADLGKLSLSLRSLATKEEPENSDADKNLSYSWDSDVSQLINQQPRTLTIVRGDKLEQVTIGAPGT